MLFRHHGLIVELKGYGSHATRHELARDAEREARLTAEHFRVITFTYDQVVHRPAEVIRLLRANLDAALTATRPAA